MVVICLFIPAVHNRLLSFHTFLLKEVKVVLDMLNWLHKSQILSSIFPKYALVMFVIDLRKSFLFMLYSAGLQEHADIATQFTL